MADIDIDKLPGMKHADFKPCICCGKGMMHANQITFYRVRIERFVVHLTNVQRAAGLELMMGGNAMLANAMGPNADLAKRFAEPIDVLVCQDCAIMQTPSVAELCEMAAPKEEAVAEEADGR